MINRVRLSCRATSIEARIFMNRQVTCRHVNKVYKAGPGRRRHPECGSQKRKNLQELYTRGTSIAGSPGRGLIPAVLREECESGRYLHTDSRRSVFDHARSCSGVQPPRKDAMT